MASALNVTPKELKEMLLFTKIMIPRQEVIIKAMDKNDCRANLATLCKAIYNSIFEWILSKLETALNPPIQMEDFYRSYKSSLKFNMPEPPPPARF